MFMPSVKRARGFTLRFDGLAEDAPYDLLAERGGATAEVVCESVSAEEGLRRSKESLEQDLRLAARVQQSLLPPRETERKSIPARANSTPKYDASSTVDPPSMHSSER